MIQRLWSYDLMALYKYAYYYYYYYYYQVYSILYLCLYISVFLYFIYREFFTVKSLQLANSMTSSKQGKICKHIDVGKQIHENKITSILLRNTSSSWDLAAENNSNWYRFICQKLCPIICTDCVTGLYQYTEKWSLSDLDNHRASLTNSFVNFFGCTLCFVPWEKCSALRVLRIRRAQYCL